MICVASAEGFEARGEGNWRRKGKEGESARGQTGQVWQDRAFREPASV